VSLGSLEVRSTPTIISVSWKPHTMKHKTSQCPSSSQDESGINHTTLKRDHQWGLHPLETQPMKASKNRRSQDHLREFGVLYRCHRRAIFPRSWPPNQWPPAHRAATNALLLIDCHTSARHIPHDNWNLLRGWSPPTLLLKLMCMLERVETIAGTTRQWLGGWGGVNS
jgi:hypothetical protein